MKPVVCVDVDGVLASWKDGYKDVLTIGEPISGAVEFTKQLGAHFDVVIHTSRCNKTVCRKYAPSLVSNVVREWLDEHGFHYDEVFCGEGKPPAVAYIDDRAVVCRPEENNEAFEYALRDCHMLSPQLDEFSLWRLICMCCYGFTLIEMML